MMEGNWNPVRLDDSSIYAKHPGKGGLVICKTAQFLVLSTYDDGMIPGVAVEATERLAEYFKSKGK